MRGILLYVIAVTMFWILSPLFLLYAIIFTSNHSKYFRNVALSIDQLGNAMGCAVMNIALIKKESGYKFGDVDQTISFVLGQNHLHKSLTLFGLLIVKILNRLDKNHVEKAVKNQE